MAEFKHISGLKELSAKLKAMPEDLRKKTLKPAVGAGAKVVRDEARILAPKYEGITARGHAPAGTLKKSIIIPNGPMSGTVSTLSCPPTR